MTDQTAVTLDAPETGRFVCPPDHLHGRTVTCYKTHRCRCQPCRDRCARVEREKYAKKKAGTYRPMVTGARAAAWVLYLEREGMTQKAICARAGVSDVTVRRLVNGIGEKILASTERAILAVKPVPCAQAGGRVDATGTRRRLGALMMLGYTGVELSARLGKSRGVVCNYLHQTMVIESTRDAVIELYDELSMTIPPETVERRKAKTWAEKAGHVPPLCWDEDTIDDPGAEPDIESIAKVRLDRIDSDVIRSAIEGEKPEMSPLERREAVRTLVEYRWSSKRVAAHIGCAARTVDRIRKKLALPAHLVNDTHYKDGTLAA